MIERCGDRQRKFDGLEKWPFHLFVESLPIMLQVSLLLLACGLCRHMWSINVSVAYILIILTILGVLFYFGIVIAGTSSYECPFQTPASSALRGFWKKIQPRAALLGYPIVASSAYAFRVLSSEVLYPMWKNIALPIVDLTHRLGRAAVQAAPSFRRRFNGVSVYRQEVHRSFPVITMEEIQQASRVSLGSTPLPPNLRDSLHGANSPTHNTDSSNHDIDSPRWEAGSPSHDSSTYTPENAGPWLTPENLAALQRTNTGDARCVSWILRNITDPEALDAAIRLAGTIRWFEDGSDVESLYQGIIPILHTCFDSTGTVYPGLSDRAYYSVRAVAWIRICAMSKPEGFPFATPLPNIVATSNDSDMLSMHSLTRMYDAVQEPEYAPFITFVERNTREHIRWTSQALLRICRTKQEDPDTFSLACTHGVPLIPWNSMPLDAVLNLLLVWSIILGTPVEEEALKVQDKTYVISSRPFKLATHGVVSLVFAWNASSPNYPARLSQPFPLLTYVTQLSVTCCSG